MKRLHVIAILIVSAALPVQAAEFACNTLGMESPNMTISYNENSHTITAQRKGFEKYYLVPQADGKSWIEFSPTPGQDAEVMKFPTKGVMQLWQGDALMSNCVEVN